MIHDLPQLDQLPLGQLKALQLELDGVIGDKEAESRDAALREITRLAGEAGLTAEAVTEHLNGGSHGRRAGRKLPAKFRNPDNPENTWAGRGKRPKWLAAKLASGARIEDFAIAPDTGVQE